MADCPIDEETAAGTATAERILAQRQRFAARDDRRGLLVAEGDSWFDYPGRDILEVLQDEDSWEVVSVAHYGDTLNSMSYSDAQLTGLMRQLEWALSRNEVPAAILLSAGGNDFAGPEFGVFIGNKNSQRPGVDDAILADFIGCRMQSALAHLVAAITRACESLFGVTIPIVVHGYDYPVPDGRGFLGGWGPLPGPWLSPSLEAKDFTDLNEKKRIAAVIVDSYNAMLTEFVQRPSASHVKYVDLLGTLPTGEDYREYWANELHPTGRGFDLLAAKFAAALDALPS
ncbi:GDSL-type esterase/lipase family protein [Aldersonia kunmingensis]|uniref:GDSL-type esterase/lipase family protein n=1 Tax=Aldersonia kunmingensis TaxID=408066 RepID=UPI0008366B00|nr:GDSL-type esterase/lipase family protein [Aldersonia kunmingensis]